MLFNLVNTKLNLELAKTDQKEQSNYLQTQDKTENWINKISNGQRFYSQILGINAQTKLYHYYSTDH